ncbi:MAG: zinc-ribbon domain-containing protein, partial [Myxococcales bacterium]|nr:zinc-ribbon domain-containing protein [Myxococcales bacterium]
MKFLCEGCKAKYTIPDEKVAGKTLRMTCRRCGEEILIRGQGVRPSSPAAGSQPASRPARASKVSAPRQAPGGSAPKPAP